jgi:hypothetical protein
LPKSNELLNGDNSWFGVKLIHKWGVIQVLSTDDIVDYVYNLGKQGFIIEIKIASTLSPAHRQTLFTFSPWF